MKMKDKILYVVVATAMGVNMIPVNVQAAPVNAPVLMSQSQKQEYVVNHILDSAGAQPVLKQELKKGALGDKTKAVALDGYSNLGYFVKPFQQQTITDDTIVSIHYGFKQFNVQFDGNGATSGSTASILTPDDGSGAFFPECGFKKTGYKFVGWKMTPSSPGNTYRPGDKINCIDRSTQAHMSTHTMYAQWEKSDTKADYSKVNAAIQKANALIKDNYKDFSAVETAVSAVVQDKPSSEQTTVDGYATAIENAIAGLELKEADYTKVNELLNTVKKLDKTKYTDFSAVENAVNAVQKGKKITEQATVDAYAANIETAINGLVEKVVEKVKISFIIDTNQGWIVDDHWNDVDQGIEVEKGKEVSFYAGAKDRFVFQSVMRNNTVISTTEDFTVTANEDMTLKINIVPATITVGLSTNAKDFGRVLPGYSPMQAEKITLENTGNITLFLVSPEAQYYEMSGYRYMDDDETVQGRDYIFLEPGEKVWFTIRPKDGLAKGTYNESISIYESLNRPMGLNQNENESLNELSVLNAKFAVGVEEFDVKATANPAEGGTTTGTGTYEKDETVKVTAQEKPDYEFVSWQEDGQVVSTQKELSFKISKDRNLVATFKKKEGKPVVEKFTITTNATPKEGGATSGAGMYKADDMVSVTAKANTGYQFIHWLEDGKVVSKDATFTFKAEKDRNLVAVFNKQAKIPTGLSTNVFSWIGLAGLSAVLCSVLSKKHKKQ